MKLLLGNLAIIAAVVLFAFPADAGKLKMRDGKFYSGVVEKLTPTGIHFLWQREKDQPQIIKSGDSDMLFQAQGHASEVRAVPFDDIETIDGVTTDRFKPLFSSNMFYRTMALLEASRIRVASTGDFVHQIVAVLALGLVMGLLIPIALLLLSRVVPGESLSFFGALGFTVVLGAVGMGFALGSSELTRMFEFFASSGAQIGLTVVLMLIIAGVMHVGTKFSFFQGIVFTVVAGLGMVLARFAVDTVAKILVSAV